MRTNNASFLPLLLLFGFVNAEAAPTTVGDLEQLTAQNVLLAAQLQGEQLQRQLRESRNDGLASSTAPTLPGTSTIATVPVPKAAAGKVLEISGTGQRLSARVALADGSVLDVVPGQVFPGTGLTVKSLSAAGVTLSDGRVVGMH
ncbi:type IV pilus biogenesis protein PilP [Serratia fonticola]|uniref:type IV pilus biogenesis protein PilP n=1 Tax=Serratia fonticola TaxID=47917 RepID=UPI0013772E15|nr:type IV pilus biogenesis protein PilP [Serratia fonticola]NCG54482.1 type IV pilus biogenesis protein PilP [Serratia fonticola]